jgi:hypothetical protein
MMDANTTIACDPGPAAEDFAAELTEAAYPVVLRHGIVDNWLDLELDLWRALLETVAKERRNGPRRGDARLHFQQESELL